jgi:hypothetical protein
LAGVDYPAFKASPMVGERYGARLDQGHVATVDAKLDLAEIEIELKHGDPSKPRGLIKARIGYTP